MLDIVLLRFLLRLVLGGALAMLLTSPREVTSGFFRIHLWMLMGMGTLAALLAISGEPPHAASILVLAVVAAVVSYLGSVFWLYESHVSGRIALGVILICALIANLLATDRPSGSGAMPLLLAQLDIVTGSLLLGATLSAMLLGHWYLNVPTAGLEPLKRLLWLVLSAVIARGAVCALGLLMSVMTEAWPSSLAAAALALRWGAGLIAALVLAIMAGKSLEIPNTQSATGMLYVGVIVVFLGELSSQLLSASSLYLV